MDCPSLLRRRIAAQISRRTEAPGPGLPSPRIEKAFRRLVENKQPRVGHQRSGDRQHLLLTAGQRPRGLVPALREAWKQRDDRLPVPRSGARCRDEVLPHGQRSETSAPLGNQADSHPGRAVRRHAGQVATREPDRALAMPHQPADRTDGRRLAHPVAPEHRDELTGPDREVDAEEGLRGAVEGSDAVDFEQRGHPASSPRYASRTFRFPRISSTVPVAMIRP